MTHWPKVVKDLKGTVRTPVTQVEEVAVKKQSIRDIGNSVPQVTVKAAYPV